MIVVSDTSPITALLSIGRIDLLADLFGSVVIPHAVAEELLRGHDHLPDFLHVSSVSNARRVEKLEEQLDRGEAEAIVLASELHADFLLMDESLGRAVARREGLPVIGLLGVLLLAKRRGKIALIAEVLENLKTRAGFHLAEDLRLRVLQEANEAR